MLPLSAASAEAPRTESPAESEELAKAAAAPLAHLASASGTPDRLHEQKAGSQLYLRHCQKASE